MKGFRLATPSFSIFGSIVADRNDRNGGARRLAAHRRQSYLSGRADFQISTWLSADKTTLDAFESMRRPRDLVRSDVPILPRRAFHRCVGNGELMNGHDCLLRDGILHTTAALTPVDDPERPDGFDFDSTIGRPLSRGASAAFPTHRTSDCLQNSAWQRRNVAPRL